MKNAQSFYRTFQKPEIIHMAQPIRARPENTTKLKEPFHLKRLLYVSIPSCCMEYSGDYLGRAPSKGFGERKDYRFVILFKMVDTINFNTYRVTIFMYCLIEYCMEDEHSMVISYHEPPSSAAHSFPAVLCSARAFI